MSVIERFEDLPVWQEARKFVHAVYQMTKEFPANERHSLTEQMQRAAISTISSIAVGFERETSAAFVNSLHAALCYTSEVRSQTYAALDLWYISQTECDDLVQHCEKLSRRLRDWIERIERASPEPGGGWCIEEPAR